MAQFGWAGWLAVPLVGTLLAAAWTWWRGRPGRAPTTRSAMSDHAAFLAALDRPVVGAPVERPSGAQEEPDSAG